MCSSDLRWSLWNLIGARTNSCVKLVPQHLNRAGRKRDSFSQEFVRAPIKFHKLQRPLPCRRDRAQHLYTFGSHFLSDSIARDDRNPRRRSAGTQGKFRTVFVGVQEFKKNEAALRKGGTVTWATQQVKRAAPCVANAISLWRIRRGPL